jgi:hypothetical protein
MHYDVTEAKRYGINRKTVAKWRGRSSTADLAAGPKEPRSTVLSVEEEAVIVAFRRYKLLPLDDRLYALQPTIPYLTRSSLHRCHLADFAAAYNFARRLKTLKGLTPYEFICKTWASQPERFKLIRSRKCRD